MRDFGVVVTVIELTLVIVPRWSVGLLVVVTPVNCLFLRTGIGATVRAALRGSS